MMGENTKIQSKMMLKVTFGAKERGGGEVIIGTAGKNSHWTRKGNLGREITNICSQRLRLKVRLKT